MMVQFGADNMTVATAPGEFDALDRALGLSPDHGPGTSCDGWMQMVRYDFPDSELAIFAYKHEFTRQYVHLDNSRPTPRAWQLAGPDCVFRLMEDCDVQALLVDRSTYPRSS